MATTLPDLMAAVFSALLSYISSAISIALYLTMFIVGGFAAAIGKLSQFAKIVVQIIFGAFIIVFDGFLHVVERCQEKIRRRKPKVGCDARSEQAVGAGEPTGAMLENLDEQEKLVRSAVLANEEKFERKLTPSRRSKTQRKSFENHVDPEKSTDEVYYTPTASLPPGDKSQADLSASRLNGTMETSSHPKGYDSPLMDERYKLPENVPRGSPGRTPYVGHRYGLYYDSPASCHPDENRPGRPTCLIDDDGADRPPPVTPVPAITPMRIPNWARQRLLATGHGDLPWRPDMPDLRPRNGWNGGFIGEYSPCPGALRPAFIPYEPPASMANIPEQVAGYNDFFPSADDAEKTTMNNVRLRGPNRNLASTTDGSNVGAPPGPSAGSMR